MNLFTAEEQAALASHKAFFLRIPWLKPHLTASGWTAHPTRSRQPKSSTEDAFFAVVLKTPDTIAHCLSLCEASELPVTSQLLAAPSTAVPIARSKSILYLDDNLSGYPHMAHGGFLGVLLDEQMGILLTCNQEFASSDANTMITQVTASLTIKFKRPVKLPGAVVVEAEVLKREGKKMVIVARVIGEKGVCVEGEAIWVEVPTVRL
jgi:acyl-coenzyme A thioesterase THEM4